MICNVCKSEWNGTSGDTKCPICGADQTKGKDQHTVPGVIAFLIKKEGADILLQPATVMSYISDLVQGHDREKKLMRVGSANGIFEKAHAVLIEPKQSKREVMVLDIRQHLMDNAFLSDENAVAIVNMALEGIGMSSLRLQSASVSASDSGRTVTPTVHRQSDRPASPPNTNAQKTAPTNDAKKTAAPNAQRKAPQQGSAKKKPFVIHSISTFSYDGSSFAARKVQGPLFLKGETGMIGILVTYNAAPADMDVSLDWQIFRQDGTPMTGEIHGVGAIKKGDTDYYQGWGWKSPGNWQVGRYTVKASMNGSNQLTTYFDVVDGKYDNPRLTMNSVRLFNAGAIPPDPSERQYTAEFPARAARRIYFEISLLKMRIPVYTTLNYKISKSSGEVFANYSVPIRFHAGDDRCWTGFGWDSPGHWQKGRYTYEVSIGEVNNIFRGVFDII